QINFGVRHVEITAENHRLAALELLEVTQKVAVPLLAISEPGKLALRVRHINIHQEEVGKLGREHAAFVVMARVADALSDVDRAGPGEYRRAVVTFLLRRVPIGGIGRRPELLDIVRAALDRKS